MNRFFPTRLVDGFKNNIRKSDELKHSVLNDATVAPDRFWDVLSYTGTISVFLILIQVVTGLLLLFYYSPNPLKAFESVIAIKNEIPNGFLFVNLHTINAKLIVLVLFIHMFRIMYVSAHRGPRKNQWYTGSVLMTLMLVTGFSGYLLPWSQQSYWACVIGTEAIRTVPLAGDLIVYLLRGGKEVAGPTLSIFYMLHIIFLPAGIIVFMWYHIKKVWQTGVAAPPEMIAGINPETCVGCGVCERICPFSAIRMMSGTGSKSMPEVDGGLCNACRLCLDKCPTQSITLKSQSGPMKTEPIFPHNMLHRMSATVVTIMILFAGVFFFHGMLIEDKIPADPFITPDRIKPDWYFMGPYQVLKIMPSEFTGLLSLLAIYLVLVFLPVIDKKGPRDPEKRPLYILLVKTSIFSFIIFTIWGFLS